VSDRAEFDRNRAALLEARRFKEARTLEAVALALSPRDALLLLKASHTLRALGDLSGAWQHLLQARTEQPRNPRILRDLLAVARARKESAAVDLLASDLARLESELTEEFRSRTEAARAAIVARSARLLQAMIDAGVWSGVRREGASLASVVAAHPSDHDAMWLHYAPPPLAEGSVVDFAELGAFAVGKPTQTLHKRLSRAIPWELPVAAFLRELALRGDPDTLIIDVGAHVGTNTVAMAKAFPGQIIALEPQHAVFTQLTDNLARNGCAQVLALRKACSARPGHGTMTALDDRNPGIARLEPGVVGAVEVVTIDDLVAASGRRLALLRMDVEGHEADIIRGAARSIARDRPVIIAEQLGAADDLADLLAQFGYVKETLYRRDMLYFAPPASRSAVFGTIFAENKWGSAESVSGTGSSLRATRELVPQLLQLIGDKGISTFIDVPCGDFNWAAPIATAVKGYGGFDIVPELIARARSRAAGLGETVSFGVLDIVEEPVPRGDAVMCRDCLVHLDLASAHRALNNLIASGSAWLLLTTFPMVTGNRDVPTGRWRPLNLQLPPFNLPAPDTLLLERPGAKPHPKWGRKALGVWSRAALVTR